MRPHGSQSPLENLLCPHPTPRTTIKASRMNPLLQEKHLSWLHPYNIQTHLNTDHKDLPNKRWSHTGIIQGTLQNQIPGLVSLMLNGPPRASSMQPGRGGILALVPASTQTGSCGCGSAGPEPAPSSGDNCLQISIPYTLFNPILNSQSNPASAMYWLSLVTCAWTSHITITSGLFSHL